MRGGGVRAGRRVREVVCHVCALTMKQLFDLASAVQGLSGAGCLVILTHHRNRLYPPPLQVARQRSAGSP